MKVAELCVSIAVLVSVFTWGLPVGRVAAAGLPNFVAVNYGPFHKDGQRSGTPIPDSQFLTDLGIITKKFKYIKTYGLDSASRLDRLVPLAGSNFPQLKVFLGVFEDGPHHAAVTRPQLDMAIHQANTYPNTVQCVVVGNECLPGDSTDVPVSVNQLIADLQYVRKAIANKNIPVTTCLAYGAARKYGKQLMPYCDIMMVNIYPFYGGVDISGAWNNLAGAYRDFSGQFPGKQMVVGETGWPSIGPKNGAAVPSIPNEQTCITQILSRAPQLGPVFLFEAFDEPWKSENQWAPHWGIWDKTGAPKINLGSFLTRDAVSIQDRSGNGIEEMALLRHDLDKREIEVHIVHDDAPPPAAATTIRFFGSGWTPVGMVALEDLNANGSQDLAVLALHEKTGVVRVVVRDSATGRLISKIDFDPRFEPKELMVRGERHLAVLGTNSNTRQSQVEVREALSGELIKRFRVSDGRFEN
ncbi:MAG TPA: glycosyl hydrolase family 17 protein [Syntrophobacteraceae bacterium]|nr:glycosyl hydrolase family 17 protein [Syntrophobacteraceae bacterium]